LPSPDLTRRSRKPNRPLPMQRPAWIAGSSPAMTKWRAFASTGIPNLTTD
jgi:alkanesulfonate monooxygenase SsuD/methylene tetrahydromethanopterin reductase-like flavin-dependent oxidoreductase (luciferase family)